MNRCRFVLAIVKGLFEHNDGTKYFGSLMGYKHYEELANNRGWVVPGTKTTPGEGITVPCVVLTDAGHRVYNEANLGSLPQSGRASGWDWSKITMYQDADEWRTT